jgi:hypothetical protein
MLLDAVNEASTDFPRRLESFRGNCDSICPSEPSEIDSERIAVGFLCMESVLLPPLL